MATPTLAEKKEELVKELEKQQNLMKGQQEALRLSEMNIHRIAGALTLIAQMEKEAADVLEQIDNPAPEIPLVKE